MLLKKYLEKLDRSYSKHKFRKVSCNSKKIKNGDVFFAINGHINNGNLFINDAIKNVGLSKSQNFILIAIGSKSYQKKLSEIINDDLDIIFKKNNQNFLKNYFQISSKTLNSIESKTPLTDLLVEKASILI